MSAMGRLNYMHELKSRRLSSLSWLLYAAAFLVFVLSAWDSGVLSSSHRSSMALLAQVDRGAGDSYQALCDSAERYWKRYPDVARDAFFGRHGAAGCRGAYDHWTRHGRREGRIWTGKR